MRDVSKAFDKVWHNGLKWKISELDLPTPYKRLLCNFLDDRTATIKIGSFIGQEIQIKSGVPQGSCKYPTLYTVFTADMPIPTDGNSYYMYADDITHIIKYQGKSKTIQARRTERAIQTINDYEKKWKIKTNMAKFEILPIAAKKTEEIRVNGEEVLPAKKGIVLGLNLTREGFTKHIGKNRQRAGVQANRLKRFRNLSIKTKLKLYKTLILPILEYPPVPLHLASKTQKHKLQVVQNKYLRWAVGEPPPYNTTIEDLHRLYKMEPINKRLEKQAKKLWEKVSINERDKYNELREVNFRRNHAWWPRSLPMLEREEEELFIR